MQQWFVYYWTALFSEQHLFVVISDKVNSISKAQFESCLIEILVKDELKLATRQQTTVFGQTDPGENNLKTGLGFSTVEVNNGGIEQKKILCENAHFLLVVSWIIF